MYQAYTGGKKVGKGVSGWNPQRNPYSASRQGPLYCSDVHVDTSLCPVFLGYFPRPGADMIPYECLDGY